LNSSAARTASASVNGSIVLSNSRAATAFPGATGPHKNSAHAIELTPIDSPPRTQWSRERAEADPFRKTSTRKFASRSIMQSAICVPVLYRVSSARNRLRPPRIPFAACEAWQFSLRGNGPLRAERLDPVPAARPPFWRLAIFARVVPAWQCFLRRAKKWTSTWAYHTYYHTPAGMQIRPNNGPTEPPLLLRCISHFAPLFRW